MNCLFLVVRRESYIGVGATVDAVSRYLFSTVIGAGNAGARGDEVGARASPPAIDR